MSTAILGGTFDPIHLGHLLIAEQAYDKFKLDDIIFMPAGSPPHKQNVNISAASHRMMMVKNAIADNSHFSFSDLELKNQKASYTVDTLKHFEDQGVDEIYFIIGSDSLIDLPNWKKPQYLMGHANFIVASRPDYPIGSVLEKDFYKPYSDNIHLIDNVRIDLSATEIRYLIKNNRSIKYLVPDDVATYIAKEKLYID